MRGPTGRRDHIMTTSQPIRPAATGSRALTEGFFADPDFDFETRMALGSTAYGVGDPGIVLATVARIVDGDRSSWFAAWSQRAEQLTALADAGVVADPRGARWAYLSASAAYSRALGAVDGLSAEQADAVMRPDVPRLPTQLGRDDRRIGRPVCPRGRALRRHRAAGLPAAARR
jgi:hypothetical protein